MNTRMVEMVDVQEWDKLVRDTYGKPYSFQQQDGCKAREIVDIEVPSKYVNDYPNSSIIEKVNGPEEGVSFKSWLDRDPKTEMKDEKDGSRWLDMFWHR